MRKARGRIYLVAGGKRRGRHFGAGLAALLLAVFSCSVVNATTTSIELRPPSGAAGFGAAVAMSADGNTVIVGAPDTGSVSNGLHEVDSQGAAWAYVRSASGWTATPLVPSDAGQYPQLGWSVAVSADGSEAAVSGPADEGVWMFERSGAGWSQDGPKLTTPDATDDFGWNVSLAANGTTALVGAPQNGDRGPDDGAAWVLTRSADGWTVAANPILPPRGFTGDEFGTTVALSGDGRTALVGADDEAEGPARVWAFAVSGVLSKPLGSTLTFPTRHFGCCTALALSASGRTALIGEGYDSDTVGSAWVFRRTGSTWGRRARLVAHGGGADGQFGMAVAISARGDAALVGAPSALVEGRPGSGAAFVFALRSSGWRQVATLAPDRKGNSGFGAGVALSGGGVRALVGDVGVGAAWWYRRD